MKEYQSSDKPYSCIDHLKWIQGSEDQLKYPCCLALVSQVLELLPWLPQAWVSALYSRHLIVFFEWYINEWLIEERPVPVFLFYLLAISHKCCGKKNLFCGRCWERLKSSICLLSLKYRSRISRLNVTVFFLGTPEMFGSNLSYLGFMWFKAANSGFRVWRM